jgi:hypothetical protein
MRRFDIRAFFGWGLILLGALLLLEKFGLVRGAASIFWGILIFLAATYFMFVFIRNPHGRWWAIIPAMTLLGMAISVVLPAAFSGLGGSIFLAGLGLAFMIVYLTDHSRWWGIIPGGVLLSLSLVAAPIERTWVNTGSIFFIGLGLTFLLVAVLPNPVGKMQWAYIPSAVLVLMGALLATQATASIADYILPFALILVGLVVVISFFIKRD